MAQGKALDFLEQLQNEVPEAASDIAELGSLYQRKLWHQLTVKIDDIVRKDGPLNSGDVPVRFFNSFVTDFAHKINLLKLAQFAVHAANSLPTPAAMIDFLQGVIGQLEDMKLPKAKEPILFLRMHVAQHKIEQVRWGRACAAAALQLFMLRLQQRGTVQQLSRQGARTDREHAGSAWGAARTAARNS